FGVWSWTGCSLVPAADRDVNCRVYPLHGAREHRRQQCRTAMDDHLRVRPGTRIWILVCIAANIAVCGFVFADIAAVVQFGSRTRSASCAGAADPCARP